MPKAAAAWCWAQRAAHGSGPAPAADRRQAYQLAEEAYRLAPDDALTLALSSGALVLLDPLLAYAWVRRDKREMPDRVERYEMERQRPFEPPVRLVEATQQLPTHPAGFRSAVVSSRTAPSPSPEIGRHNAPRSTLPLPPQLVVPNKMASTPLPIQTKGPPGHIVPPQSRRSPQLGIAKPKFTPRF